MARAFFDFRLEAVTPDNWEALYDRATGLMQQPDWAERVLRQSKLEAVFLTNDFDDPLEGFDTRKYIPCLRTDDLVFHLAQPSVRMRLDQFAGAAVHDAASLRSAIGTLFEHFTGKGARACAISLPPDFSPASVSASQASAAVDDVFRQGAAASEERRRELGHFVFWTLAEFCDDYRLPFDLMIGVNRGVYADGVFQGATCTTAACR